MWGGVALAAASAVLVIPAARFAGVGLFAASAAMSIAGAWLKKRHCPHCRVGECRIGGGEGGRAGGGEDGGAGAGGRADENLTASHRTGSGEDAR